MISPRPDLIMTNRFRNTLFLFANVCYDFWYFIIFIQFWNFISQNFKIDKLLKHDLKIWLNNFIY